MMGEKTKIQWCDHTFNPWRGCTKISTGCDNCYAEQLARRNPAVLGEWGPTGNRPVAAASTWQAVDGWNRKAHNEGRRRRIFVGSMMDVFEDREDLYAARRELWRTILECQYLDFLLLTKRPENLAKCWPTYGELGGIATSIDQHVRFSNVWLGTSIEDQRSAESRVPALMAAGPVARVLFLSYEPAIDGVDLEGLRVGDGSTVNALDGTMLQGNNTMIPFGRKINWVIAGGESGPRARPCNVDWVRAIARQCKTASIACFIKQLGSRPFTPHPGIEWEEYDPKGGDPGEWPEDLRVREFPA